MNRNIKWQKKSEELDFSQEGRTSYDDFNQVIWVAVKGEGVPNPALKRSAFLKVSEEED